MLIEDLATLLGGLSPAGGVWYGINTQQPAVFPYIVFQRVASDANASLGGPSALQNTRVQIDIYAAKISEAAALETQLESAMAAWTVQNVPILSQDFFEYDARAFRVSKDYSVWSTS